MNKGFHQRPKYLLVSRTIFFRLIIMGTSGVLKISLLVLAVCIPFIGVYGNDNHHHDDEWIDPFDMLNYDATSKTMRTPAKASSYSNVPTKRREYSSQSCELSNCPDIKECTNKLDIMVQEIEAHKRKGLFSSQQSACYPVFKRFLSKLLREIEKLGLPTDVNTEKHYDAEVKLSTQMVEEIRKLLMDDDSWRTGSLDDALSQILINFKLHDHEAWKWRFEDTFGVDPDIAIKVILCVLIIVVIICTEMWSLVSWFVQFKRMFAICFVMSLIWNWFYLYKMAFADHQANIVKMENVNEKCTGVTKIDWMDNLREWFRTTLTLQDDPCKQYYQVLVVNPILLVPPTKALTMTITAFITDPLKHIGQGISEFLRALLKDLPVTLQIPVLICVVAAVLVFMYSSGQAAVHHAVFRPLRAGFRNPTPGVIAQPRNLPLRDQEDEEEADDLRAGGYVNHTTQTRPKPILAGNKPHQVGILTNQESRGAEVQRVENIGNAENLYSVDKTDAQQGTAGESSIDHGLNLEKKENKTRQQIKPELNAQSAPKERNVDSTSVASRTSGGDKCEVRGAKSASGNEEDGKSIGTPVQETKPNEFAI